MKKYLPLLLCSLLTFSACNFEDSYTQTNVQDLVTVKGDNLVNDYGYTLTVTQDAVGRANWQSEGARYYAIYDVLNRNFDIYLKEVIRSREELPLRYDDQQEYPTDPIEPYVAAFSGGYLNIGLYIYKAKNTNNAHVVRFFYEMESTHMYVHVVHYGSNEDPAHMSTDDLTYEQRMYHIDANEFPSFTQVTLVAHYLDADGSGNPVIKLGEYQIK